MKNSIPLQKKQDRQYMYNVTLKHVFATIVAVENNEYFIFQDCVCL